MSSTACDDQFCDPTPEEDEAFEALERAAVVNDSLTTSAPDSETIQEAAAVLDTLTSNLVADHPLRIESQGKAKALVDALYQIAVRMESTAAVEPDIHVTLSDDPRGIHVAVHDGQRCVYAGVHGVPAVPLLAAEHKGMRVDYSGMLMQASNALVFGVREPGLAEMLRQLQGHLTDLGLRWYAGDTAVVDELCQLYCIASSSRACLATQGASRGDQ